MGALMELAFRQATVAEAEAMAGQRKGKKQRRLTFDEIAQHCRVGPKEVEYLVMKTMCANLIRGKVDEVAQIVMVTWVKPRILDTIRINWMRQHMDDWSSQTGKLLTKLEEMTPELLVT